MPYIKRPNGAMSFISDHQMPTSAANHHSQVNCTECRKRKKVPMHPARIDGLCYGHYAEKNRAAITPKKKGRTK